MCLLAVQHIAEMMMMGQAVLQNSWQISYNYITVITSCKYILWLFML